MKLTKKHIALVVIFYYDLMAQQVKNPPAMQETQEPRLDPWVGKIPWRRAWQPTPVFLPGESCGQRRLLGHTPRGHKESDRTEVAEQQQQQSIDPLLYFSDASRASSSNCSRSLGSLAKRTEGRSG